MYWIIEGIGLNADEIRPYINTEKIARFFYGQWQYHDSELEAMISSGDYSGFDMDDYLEGGDIDDLGDVLYYCDDTDTLSSGDDGRGNAYFYYPPSMPWHLRENDPKSEQEVIERITAAVQKITDMTAEEIEPLIKDLYVVGNDG